MKLLALALALALAVPCATAAKKKDATAAGIDRGLATINAATAKAHIGFLAADEIAGREAGTAEGRICANYIVSTLMQMGLQPLQPGDYFQPFTASHAERQLRGKRWQVDDDSVRALARTTHQELHLRNILAFIPGRDTLQTVVIGAHYDHLGTDPMLSGDQIYNGADDNASGVQAVLQVARAFIATGLQPQRNVIFAFWDGEEKGLLGSQYFTAHYPRIGQVKGYLNYDMIGRDNKPDDPQYCVYFYTAAHPAFGDWLRDDIAARQLRLNPSYRSWDNPVGGSDNASFARLGIPIIWYHTDAHPDYHQPGDEAAKINWEKCVDITRASFLAMWRLANEPTF